MQNKFKILFAVVAVAAITTTAVVFFKRKKQKALPTSVAQTIINAAAQWVGVVEIQPNKGFNNANFQKKNGKYRLGCHRSKSHWSILRCFCENDT